MSKQNDKEYTDLEALEADEKVKEAKPRKGATYKNLANGPVLIYGKRVPRGGVYEVTAEDKQDDRGTAKLKRFVELGFIEKD